jgi:phosphopantothenoylcysteine synthetase/decarboxylase
VVQLALEREHDVTCFMGLSAQTPEPHSRLRLIRYGSAADLWEKVRVARDVPPDSILHAAAVADYTPERRADKMPSGQGSWQLSMHPSPKLAPLIRQEYPEAALMLCKLEVGVSLEELRKKARDTAHRSGAQWVFANLLEDVGEDHSGWLLSGKGSYEEPLLGRGAIAEGMLRALEETPQQQEGLP